MLGNIKVGTKLIAGFMVVAAIAAFIGVMGINSSTKMRGNTDLLYSSRLVGVNALGDVESGLASLRIATRTMAMTEDPMGKGKAAFEQQEQDMKKYTEEVLAALETAKGCARTEKSKQMYQQLSNEVNQFITAVNNTAVLAKKANIVLDPTLSAAFEDQRDISQAAADHSTEWNKFWMETAKQEYQDNDADAQSTINTAIALLIAGVVIAIVLGLILSNSISGPLNKTVAMLKDLSLGHLSTRLRMNRKDEIGIMAATMDKFADDLQNEVIGTMKQIAAGDLSANVTAKDAQDEITPALRDTLDALRDLIVEDGGRVLEAAAEKDLSKRMTKEYKGDYATMENNINKVVESLDDAMKQVSEAVGQVSSASGQISQGAQSLAEGANVQASSLEEISSSLEEISSMTKQNADNSNQAKQLVVETNAAISEASAAMQRMATAIHDIKDSSDSTAKILKTIDDIAFQTNLLALNAAVEAARAGDAGKGFAVVAGEVRNLAMRSAEAAKNTADMIEESVKNADNGVKITEDVANALHQAVERSTKVNDLVAEVAAASNEQSLGVEQVNTAVAQMNQVTQQNAANSEESASAAEELSSQAAELANMVGTFTVSEGEKQEKAAHAAPAIKTSYSQLAPRSTQVKMPAVKVSTSKALVAAKTASPDDIIPLDGEELGEF